jgi:hypothetical protein
MSDYGRKPGASIASSVRPRRVHRLQGLADAAQVHDRPRQDQPRRVTGNCAQHQHQLATAIKRGREMALLPYTVPVVSGRVGKGR